VTEIITIAHKTRKVRHAGLFTYIAPTIPCAQAVWRDWPGNGTKVLSWFEERAQKPR